MGAEKHAGGVFVDNTTTVVIVIAVIAVVAVAGYFLYKKFKANK